MSETLGSLCDKLTVVKLKQYHAADEARLSSLAGQENSLCSEIDDFLAAALAGDLAVEKLALPANKVYKKEGNKIPVFEGNIGEVFAELAKVNCDLWHEQEKVYEFEKVPAAEKDGVIKRLALLNLQRSQCIDSIDKEFQRKIIAIRNKSK